MPIRASDAEWPEEYCCRPIYLYGQLPPPAMLRAQGDSYSFVCVCVLRMIIKDILIIIVYNILLLLLFRSLLLPWLLSYYLVFLGALTPRRRYITVARCLLINLPNWLGR